MKIFVLLFLTFFFQCNLFAQPGFSKVYITSPDHANYFDDVLVDDDTIVVLGYTYNDTLDVSGRLIMKIDTFGNILSQSFFTDSLYELLSFAHKNDLIKTKDEGYAFWGVAVAKSGIEGNDKLFLQKVKKSGESQFVKFFEMLDDTSSLKVLNERIYQMEDEGYFLVGLEQRGNYELDPVVLRTDKDGNLLWRRRYGDDDISESLIELVVLDNNQFVLGMLTGNGLSQDEFEGYSKMIAVDSVGNVLWEWTSGAEIGWLDEFLPTDDKGWVLAASNYYWETLYGGLNFQPKVVRLDSNFNIVWERAIPWSLSNPIPYRFESLVQHPSGDYIAAGSFNTAVSPIVNAVHYRITPSGDSVWMRFDSVILDQNIGWSNEIVATAILSSGSIVSCGHTRITDSNGTGDRGWIIKLNANGCVDTLSCWPLGVHQLTIEQEQVLVFPNPATETVHFELKGNSEAFDGSIRITDILGKVIKEIPVRNSVLRWDVSLVSDGVYFYHLDYSIIKNRRQRISSSGTIIVQH